MPAPLGMAIAMFLAWLLGLSGSHKLRDQNYYASLLQDYLGVDRGSSRPLMVVAVSGLAMLELGLAILLLLPVYRAPALVCAIVLLVAYALLMAVQLRAGKIALECGCAGPASGTRISASLVLRNLIVAGIAYLALLPPIPIAVALPQWPLGIGAGVFMVLLYLCCEQLISNAQRIAAVRG